MFARRDVLADRGGRDVRDPALLHSRQYAGSLKPVSSTQSCSSGSHDSWMHRFAVSSEWPGCGIRPGPSFSGLASAPSGVDRSSVMLLPLFLTPLSQLELIDVIGDFAPSTIVESVVDMEFKPVAVR